MTSHVQELPGVAVPGSGAGAAPGQDVTRLPDLASRSLCGSVVHANDELFAERENLVKPEAPSYSTYTLGHEGQVCDGWGTRRRREPGFDHAIVRLGAPRVVRGVVVDTAFSRGTTRRRCPERFDQVLPVRAAGRSPTEMLTGLRRRLGNDPESERREVAGQLRQITRLRLERSLQP